MRRAILILPILLALFSCEDEKAAVERTDMIVGAWNDQEYKDSIQIMKKVNSLSGDEYGIQFLDNGKLKEIKNSGWCGTPPISYGEFSGTWELQGDSILYIESTYWGGEISQTWQILEIDNSKMSFYVIDYHTESVVYSTQ